MIDTPFQALVIDYSCCSLLRIDIPTGEILSEIPYPSAIRPTGIFVTEDQKTAYIPAAKNGGAGLLFALSLKTLSLYQLPVELPHPIQFTLAPGGKKAFLSGPDSTLYCLDLQSLVRQTWGSMAGDCICAGIAADTDAIYTVWEYPGGGCLATFDIQGQLKGQYPFSGTPTSISLTRQGLLLVSFTNGIGGEGILSFDTIGLPGNCPSVIHLLCSECAKGLKAYPLQLILSPDENLLYAVNEDSASVSVISLPYGRITGCIPIGHSISSLALSADGRFAAGASNSFADLCLIDLVNRRLVSISNTSRELSGFIVSVG